MEWDDRTATLVSESPENNKMIQRTLDEIHNNLDTIRTALTNLLDIYSGPGIVRDAIAEMMDWVKDASQLDREPGDLTLRAMLDHIEYRIKKMGDVNIGYYFEPKNIVLNMGVFNCGDCTFNGVGICHLFDSNLANGIRCEQCKNKFGEK